MHDESLPLPKVFHITRRWRIVILLCSFISVIWGIGSIWLLVSALNESKNVAYDMIVALLSLGMASLLLWGFRDYSKSRLVLTSHGITYYGSGFRVYTPWQNIVGIGNTLQNVPLTVSWTSKLIGFRLRQNAVVRMKLEEGIRQGRAVIETDWWYPVSMRAPYVGFFIIDEIIRERHWQQGELGTYLHHCAPQAFEELDFVTQKERSNG